MIKTMSKFTSKIYQLQGELFGSLSPRQGLSFRMCTPTFMKLNRSLLSIQSFTFSSSERDLMSVDFEALHKAVKLNRRIDFIRLLPLHSREIPTLKIAQIIAENLERKNDTLRLNLTLPILTQAFGAGKSFFMVNLPKLFAEYCPENKQLKESYHIYVDLKKLPSGPENVEYRLYSLIFSSFLKKYDAVPEDFPRSIDESNIQLLAKFIRGNTSPGEFKELLRQLKVREDKIDPIIKDFNDKKFSLIIFEIDELGRAEEEDTYSKEEKGEIQKKIDLNNSNINIDQNNLSKLIRLYHFWRKLEKLMVIDYFEVIAAGKGTSCLLGKKIPFEPMSPCRVSQIILDPLTKEDITAILNEVLLKSNMIDINNLEKLLTKIYFLTAGHPLYVGFSIYYYFFSVLYPNKDLEFNLETALKDDGEVQSHISMLMDNVRMYKNVWRLYQFFIDVVKGKKMHKDMNWRITQSGPYIKTVELLDNLGISYSNGKASIITPILPGIFKEEFELTIKDNFETGAIERGVYEERFFAEAFLHFSRNRHLNPANNSNVYIKKMFPCLKRFPEFLQTKPFSDKYNLLPKITNSANVIVDEGFDFTNSGELNPVDYPKLLQQLEENVLYRHKELSSSCDFIFVQKIDKDNKLFLLFQIKNSKTNVNLKGEYNKVFKNTKLEEENEKGCLYRLIIFNSAVTTGISFNEDEACKTYFYDKKVLKQLSEDYKEMDKKILMYYVNPSEVKQFKQLEKLF